MDGLKLRAGEKIEALHVAAKTAAGSGKSRVDDIYQHAAETLRKFREAFNEIWQHELVIESRNRVAAFTSDTIRRIKEGTPPLSPVLLYEELKALFKDRVWRRSMLLVVSGFAVGVAVGAAVGARVSSRSNAGPHARALHSHADQSVILVEDAVSAGASTGEVLVRVQAFSVCPLDRAVLRGHAATLRGLVTKGHVSVGRGFSGVVLDVGYGVSSFELGDEVWGCVSEWAGGAAAELLTIRSTRLSKRPRGISADSAAALPWGGATALAALDQLHYSQDTCKGKRVAICGANSAEGVTALQLLRKWGADVSAAASRHVADTLHELGATEYIASESLPVVSSLEAAASLRGPWDGVLVCGGGGDAPSPAEVLRATAPRNAILDLRPRPFISDRLPTPFSLMFGVTFYTYRAMRWLVGCGSHSDWLEDGHRLTPGLERLARLVEDGSITPILDKVYLPQDFESALAHACSEEAIGTTVIRFLSL